MNCKIQKPVPVQTTPSKGVHGKLKVQTTCNDMPEDEIKFDATSGDIKLKLNCKEPEGYDDDWFILDNSDLLAEIEKLKTKMEELETEVEALKNKHEVETAEINQELTELKTEMETLNSTEEAELETINESLDELYEMLNNE